MADTFDANQTGLTSPAVHGLAITPHNDNDLATTTRGIYVGGSGDLAVILDEDTVAVTFVGLAAGVVHPLRVRRVLVAGTNATSIVGVW